MEELKRPAAESVAAAREPAGAENDRARQESAHGVERDAGPRGGGAGAGRATGFDPVAAAQAIEAFLRAIGHPPESDPQLANTGRLVSAAFHDELLAGYRMDPAAILADTMPAGRAELVVVRGIDVTCICPHHLLPASGVVHVGYLPAGRLVGLGAIARLARCFARRLILQEALCEQIAQALVDHLGAAAAGCIADLSPACLTCRGERPAGARVVSLATAGRMREDAQLRREFMTLAGRHGQAGGWMAQDDEVRAGGDEEPNR